jgi:hypothetical protein
VYCDNIVKGCNRLTTIGFEGKTHKVSARKIIDIFNDFISQNSVNVFNLSRRVDVQEEEMLMNLMASTNLFEMFLSLTGGNLARNLSLSSNNNYDIINIYAILIQRDKKSINDIPLAIRSKVEELLIER